MNNRAFKIGDGEIQFIENKIIIYDKIKRHHLIQLTGSVMWIIYGVTSILRYMKTSDQFLLWSGLLIGIGHLVRFIIHLFRSTNSEISNSEISSLKIKKRFGNNFLDIKLKNGMIRRVAKLDNIIDELRLYIQTERN